MRTITAREALREALFEEMRRDPLVFLMGEEVAEYHGAYKISNGLLEEFGPSRVIDTPICEYGFTGIASGAAMRGLRPIVEFMSFNFSMQAIDHIINSAAKTLYMSSGLISCPIVFRGLNGAASQVAAQHSQCYASWYAHCPGLKVVAPYDAQSSKCLLKAAIRDPNPVVFFENEFLYNMSFEIDDSVDVMPLDKAIIRKSGSDVSIVTFSYMTKVCLDAAYALQSEYGISAEVIDLVSLRPIDTRTIIASLAKTSRIITVEEGWPSCGIGAEIAAIVNEHGFDLLDAEPVRITGKDTPTPYAKNLEKMAFPVAGEVVHAARRLVGW